MPRRFQHAYSYTRLWTFDRCPLWFDFRYRQEIPEPETLPLQIGKAAHVAAERYGRLCTGEGHATDFSTFEEQIVPEALQFVPDEGRTDLTDILATMKESLAFDGMTLEDTFFELELAFDEQWNRVDWKDEAVFFRAKIDRLRRRKDALRITDWKTNRQIEPESELARDLQFRIYMALAIMMQEPVVSRTVTVERFYLRYGYSQTHEYVADEAGSVVRDIMARAERIEAETEWKPRLGDHCRWCPYTARCESFRAAYAGTDFVVRDEAHAAELAARLSAIKASEKQLDAALRAYVEAHAPIPIDEGKLLGFTPVEKNYFDDARAVVEQLKAMGVDKEAIWQALNTTQAKLKPLAKKVGKTQKNFIDELLPLATKKVEAHFKIFKPGAGGGDD